MVGEVAYEADVVTKPAAKLREEGAWPLGLHTVDQAVGRGLLGNELWLSGG